MAIFRFLITLCFLFSLSSCTEKEDKVKKTKEEWEILDIELTNNELIDNTISEKVAIFKGKDSCVYSLTVKNKDHFTKYGEFDQKKYTFYLDKKSKEKLFRLFKDLIENPTPTNKTVSCYAGTFIKFTINRYLNPTLSCEYSSVEDWTEISKSTKEIYNLTLKKIPFRENGLVTCNHGK